MRGVETVRQVVVFDAADLHVESAFWAGVLGGQVFEDDAFHSVIDADGEWRIGIQLAPDHSARLAARNPATGASRPSR